MKKQAKYLTSRAEGLPASSTARKQARRTETKDWKGLKKNKLLEVAAESVIIKMM